MARLYASFITEDQIKEKKDEDENYPCRNRKSMMTRQQFGLKMDVLRMTFATCVTGINLKLSTSPSVANIFYAIAED